MLPAGDALVSGAHQTLITSVCQKDFPLMGRFPDRILQGTWSPGDTGPHGGGSAEGPDYRKPHQPPSPPCVTDISPLCFKHQMTPSTPCISQKPSPGKLLGNTCLFRTPEGNLTSWPSRKRQRPVRSAQRGGAGRRVESQD